MLVLRAGGVKLVGDTLEVVRMRHRVGDRHGGRHDVLGFVVPVLAIVESLARNEVVLGSGNGGNGVIGGMG